MKYNPNKIEADWQKYWAENQTFAATNNSEKPKYYVLDMFPYPSGAGLHVGHPLGYIASDIYARYKRHKGFNVLHPQGYDSFGLPAEQYAIQTGQHPDKTTKENIARYRDQLDKIGFSFDWSREVRTSSPEYYKWTQWIFIQLFNSWYNKHSDKAEDIQTLIMKFEENGNANVQAVCDENIAEFTAAEWQAFSSEDQQKILLQYRLTYLAETEVNWCPALGTVLANDEIVNGMSERGGHPVIRKKMTQWSMRISAYAQRLLDGLNDIDWTQSLKDAQTNWIGKSVGASIVFHIISKDKNTQAIPVEVFTTRPDTVFGVTFMTLAPEHELVSQITTADQKAAVDAYIEATSKRSERERMADVKTISGVFTGAYAEHPFTKEPVPVWVGDYVLAGYGTGAVMAVPAGDERDHAFANFFKGQNGMPEIRNIFEGVDISEAAFTSKDNVVLANSVFLNGLNYKEATKKAIAELERIDHGKGKTNYRLRDAVFSRQRYWGEPFPVYYVKGLPRMIDVAHLPIRLPEVEKYLPTEDGQPPLGNSNTWAWDATKNEVVSTDKIDNLDVFPLELNTMPGWAGSSWYWLRYMDAHNETTFVSKEAEDYWQNVDLYIGGSEHATGHLLYSRFWNKFLKDRGFVNQDEPFKKLINQGMILGNSAYFTIESYSVIFPLIDMQGTLTKQQRNFEYPVSLKTDQSFTDLILKDISELLFKQKAWFENPEEFLKDVSNWAELREKYVVWKIDFEQNIGLTTAGFRQRFIGSSSFFYDSNLAKYVGQLPDDITEKIIARLKMIGVNVDDILIESLRIETENIDRDYSVFKSFRPYPVLIDLINDVTGELNVEKFKSHERGFDDAIFIYASDNKFYCYREVEKMSKSKYNVVTPDDICADYGADTLRLYEMFLGPLEQAKPWNTAGITGVFGFLKKLWRLYFDDNGLIVNSNPASKDALKTLHKTIKKVQDDIEGFSFNTSVSQFMICVNELSAMNCHERSVLEPLSILISPYAPHIAEELWKQLGHEGSISTVPFPIFNPEHLVESSKEYPVSFNGKTRFTIELPLDLSKEQIEEIVMIDERTIKQLEGKTPNKVIIVPGKIINLVG